MAFYKQDLEWGSYFFGVFYVANSQEWMSGLVIFFVCFSRFCCWFMIWIGQNKSCNSVKLSLCISFPYIKRAITIPTTTDILNFESDLFTRDLEIFGFKTIIL